MSSYTVTCETCKISKDVGLFEPTPSGMPRGECKACRAERRSVAVAARPAPSPDEATMPRVCAACGRGPPEVDFQWRVDTVGGSWRRECGACTNTMGYSEAYRGRVRAADEEAYQRRNASYQTKWRNSHPEKVAAMRDAKKTDPGCKIKEIMKVAAGRCIPFEVGDRDAMVAMFSLPCVYCGSRPEGPGDVLNGLDREDLGAGYRVGNAVPCCTACAAMKGTCTTEAFVAAVRGVAEHQSAVGGVGGGVGGSEYPEAPPNLALASPCFLCGRTPALGIDDDSRPCCAECGTMKKGVDLADFVRRVTAVAEHTADRVLGDAADDTPTVGVGGVVCIPVQAIDSLGGFSIAFPSVVCAAAAIGVTDRSIRKAVEREGALCRRCRWIAVPPSTYRTQRLDPTYAERALVTLRERR